MSESTQTTQTNWRIEHEGVDPIRVRDPVAEALAVLDPGEPFAISYRDVVKAAGHSCPTAAGAFRITQLALDALYPDSIPVRSEIAVTAGGPEVDPGYGVTSRLVSYITGAAGAGGFGGLGGGHGGRKNMLSFDEIDADGVAFEFERTDTGERVRVVYDTTRIPSAGPATNSLPKLIDGSASDEEREAFAAAWHGRVQTVLTDDEPFTVERV